MQTVNTILLISALIGNIILSLFTLLRNPTSATNRLFFGFTITLIFYLLTNFWLTRVSTDTEAIFWVRYVMSVAAILNLLFLLLTHTFPKPSFSLNKIVLSLSIISTIIMIFAAQSDLIFVSAKAHGAQGVPGPAMPLFLAHTLLLLGGGFVLLIKKFRNSTGLEKSQAKLFLIGTIFMFLAIVVINLLFVLVFNTGAFVGLLPFYTLVFVGSISYAIVKHRFLDIGLLVARSVAYVLFVLAVAGFSTFGIFLVSNFLFKYQVTLEQSIYYSLLTFILILLSQPMKKIIEYSTNQVFYKNSYNSDNLLAQLTRIMASTFDLRELTRQSLKELTKVMQVSYGSFLLVKDGMHYPPISEGISINLSNDIQSLDLLAKSNKIIILDEEEDAEIKGILRKLNISVVLPLFVGNQSEGVLLLGEKKSGEVFSSKDIKVLEILGPEVSVAIQNSLAYDEIKRFNVTLKEEVEKSTSNLRSVNEEVSRMNRQLQDLDKLKDDFVSIASHELRTPMTAIRSYSWMALNKSDIPLSPKMRKYLERILISTERLINLVNDMLNISRIESGRIEIVPEPFDMLQLIKDVYTEVEPKSQEKGIKLNIVGSNTPKVFADIDKVHQVLLNIIGNALKFTPNQGIITISFFVNGQTVEIAVQDSGVGISAEDRARLFQKFGRLDNSYVAAATSGGTGLGLYICKNLVELMKGRIWVESAGVGKGSKFIFSLPIATGEMIAQAAKLTVRPSSRDVKTLEPVAI